jgi:mRNA interferase RelE/StbE
LGSATQVYYSGFDTGFFRLPVNLQERIQARLDAMSRRLNNFPHHRLTGSDRYRVRIGDYRVIYNFDLQREELYLFAVGHRREIYR